MKIKLPFLSQNTSNFILGFAALMLGILDRAGRVTAEPKCIEPIGDYENSCDPKVLTPYSSSDLNVPAACEFKTSCATIFSGLPRVQNTIYIPADVLLENVVNNNGTLHYQTHPLTKPSKSKVVCAKPSGSYSKTCEVDTHAYTSTDPNLRQTELCEATVECETTTSNTKSSMMYFNIRTSSGKAVQRVENCDGKLVAHVDDKRCQGVKRDEIKNIADKEGALKLKL